MAKPIPTHGVGLFVLNPELRFTFGERQLTQETIHLELA